MRSARNRHERTAASSRGWVRPVVIGSALLVGVGLGTGGTFALWNDGTSSAQGSIIRTGDLELALVGTPQWQETSTDVAGTPRSIDPATFLVRPGDTVRVTQQATAKVQGDNLNATFQVNLSGASLPTGVTATATILDGATVLGSGPAGSPVTISQPVVGNDAGVTRNVTVRIDVAVAASVPDLVRAPGTANDVPAFSLGTLGISLTQVRAGGGFQ